MLRDGELHLCHSNTDNTLAKIAFSDAYDTLTSSGQNTGAVTALSRIKIEKPQQEYDKDVLLLKRELGRRSSQNGDETSDVSLTEPNTDTEQELREYGMVWIGCYLLSFEPAPSAPDLGWTVGKRVPQKNPGADLVLCTRLFTRKYGIDLPIVHARFNFAPDNRALFIAGCSRSQLAQLRVNGEAIQRRLFTLNQHKMKIGFGNLEYVFEYTPFAATKAYVQQRHGYTTGLGAPQFVPFEVPTPLVYTRTMGEWTLGDPLGRGGHGKVFLATNTKNKMAAIKVVERTSKGIGEVSSKVATNAEVTELAKQWDKGGRIMRQINVLYFSEKRPSGRTGFDEIAIILQPATPETFNNLLRTQSKG